MYKKKPSHNPLLFLTENYYARVNQRWAREKQNQTIKQNNIFISFIESLYSKRESKQLTYTTETKQEKSDKCMKANFRSLHIKLQIVQTHFILLQLIIVVR